MSQANTDRNRRAHTLYCEGYSDKEIAAEMDFNTWQAAHSARYRFEKNHPDEARRIKDAAEQGERPTETPNDATVTRTRIDEQGNELEAVVTSRQIRTVEQLIEAHEIDLNVWRQVGKITHKTWPTPMKLKIGNGREVAATVQNHYLAVNFIKRDPEPLFPIPRPLQVPVTYAEPPEPERGALRRSLIIADAHFGFRRNAYTGAMEPFHDRRVLDLALQLATALDVDDIDWLGDQQDAAEFSTHFRGEPQFHKTTLPALIEHHWWLRQFREARPRARMQMLEGNHDKRLRSALAEYLPAALDLRRVTELDAPPALSWANLLALDELRVIYRADYPNGREWRNNTLCLLHADVARSTPGSTARKILERIKGCVAFGHIHRKESISQVEESRGQRRTLQATCAGCACRVDDRVPGSENNVWTQGLMLATYDAGGNFADLQAIKIHDGRAVVNGAVYTARNRTSEIEKMLTSALATMEPRRV